MFSLIWIAGEREVDRILISDQGGPAFQGSAYDQSAFCNYTDRRSGVSMSFVMARDVLRDATIIQAKLDFKIIPERPRDVHYHNIHTGKWIHPPDPWF